MKVVKSAEDTNATDVGGARKLTEKELEGITEYVCVYIAHCVCVCGVCVLSVLVCVCLLCVCA